METRAVTTLDAKGLSCPLPIIKTAHAMKALMPGDTIEVLATDPGSKPDFEAWCSATGHTLEEQDASGGVFRFVIKKKE